jgi:hypothetical protein
VISLSSTAFFHVGVIPDPDVGKAAPNLPLARHTIQILEMLQSKTRGNLDADEQRTIDDLLYRLRLAYVDACKARS